MNWRAQINKFPVQVALAALLVYLATLATDVTVSSLALTAKLAGWDHQPLAGQPVFWLLTLPIRLLPSGWIPLASNALSAVCAAVTLGFLAATLELAAWNRPLQSLAGWRARLPLLLAVVVCGLEFSFWQAGTQGNGESLHILLIAVPVWCLFKYRATESMGWLRLACLIWGAGMAENWTMVLLLPFFVVIVFWLGHKRLLKWPPLARLALMGIAGFSVLALPAMINGAWPNSPWGVLESGRETFRAFKAPLMNVYGVFWRSGKLAPLAVVLFYLLPLLPVIVRIHDAGTRNMSALDRYQVWLTRILRVALLLLLLWLAFDPAVGLRQILREKFGVSLSLLSLDYLVALGAALLGGNLLLVLTQNEELYRRHTSNRKSLIPALSVRLFTLLLGVTTLGLLWRNTATITLPNRQPFSSFGADILSHLPVKRGMILADEPLRLYSFQAAAGRKNQARQWLAINTDLLTRPEYCRWVAKTHAGWIGAAGSGEHFQAGPAMLKTLIDFTRSNSAFYLHPSFGFYFDQFYLRPEGPAQQLVKFSDRSISPPALTGEQIQSTEQFWDSVGPRLTALKQSGTTDGKSVFGWASPLCARLQFEPHDALQSKLLTEWYATALDDWGVQLQQAGRLEAAQKRFRQALDLNDRNVSARINYLCNSNLLAGQSLNLAWYPSLASELGDIRKLNRFLQWHGPVDEPAFCFLRAKNSVRAGLPRQGLQFFERADALAPNTPATRIELARLYAQCGFEQKARDTIQSLRDHLPPAFLQTNSALDISLSLLEAGTWMQSSNVTNSKNVMRTLLEEHPDDPRTALLVIKTYLAGGEFTNALELVDQQVKKNPADVGWQIQKAFVLNQAGQLDRSLTLLDEVLTRTNLPAARLLRGKVQMSAGRWDESESDLRQVSEVTGYTAVARLGLAEISLHRQDTNAAVEHLQLGLKEVPPDSPYARLFNEKIRELRKK